MVSSLYFLNEHKKLVHSVASRLAHDTVMFFDHIKPKNNSFATLVPKFKFSKIKLKSKYEFPIFFQTKGTFF